MIKTQVIVVAGGLGTRFKSKVPKPFVLLKGKPLTAYSLSVFEKNAAIDSVIIVGHQAYLNRFKLLAKPFKKVKAIVAGGETRADSVKCGLKDIDQDTAYVLVHDAARPFVSQEMIRSLLDALKKHSAAIIAVPVKATIKQVNSKSLLVQSTPNRKELWEVQTPQAFKREVLVKAHAKVFKGEATDDAMLVENLGLDVKVVAGTYQNIKITTPEDLDIAEQLHSLKDLTFDRMVVKGLADSKNGKILSDAQLKRKIKTWRK